MTTITKIGVAVPDKSLDQETFTKWAAALAAWPGRQERLIPILFRRSGIEKRHSVLLEGDPLRQEFFQPAHEKNDRGPTLGERMERYEREAAPLALRAAKQALGDDRALTHLVTVSCSGFQAPGVDVALIRHLELPATTQRTHIGFMGCHGALNGLRVAQAIVRAERKARVLVCAVELCSLHYDYRAEVEPMVANSLFSDGAAAALVEASDDANDAWRIEATGACVWPSTEDLMQWRIRDHGFEMGLSASIPRRIEEHLAPWLDGWLAEHSVKRHAIKSWAVHPGGPRILSAVEKALALSEDDMRWSREVLANYGNMSSPTVLFILKALQEANAKRPCIALGFGPGLAVEATLLL